MFENAVNFPSFFVLTFNETSDLPTEGSRIALDVLTTPNKFEATSRTLWARRAHRLTNSPRFSFVRTFVLGLAVDQPRHSLETLVIHQMILYHVRPPVVFAMLGGGPSSSGVGRVRQRQVQQEQRGQHYERPRTATRRHGVGDHRRPDRSARAIGIRHRGPGPAQ